MIGTKAIAFPLFSTQLAAFFALQTKSCLFPLYIFFCLAITQLLDLPLLARYDWLLLFCLLMQGWMVYSGLETKDELKVITVFHFIGLGLELFKVNIGSWSYPEEGLFTFYGVPLYSGFMYASVASYLCQCWRRFDVQVSGWPSLAVAAPLALAIYTNFFTHHYVPDIRWMLFALVAVVFWKSHVLFKINQVGYSVPLLLYFFLIGLLIWLAENIATFFGAWQYPNQSDVWSFVHIGKISSWLLLVIVSFLIVASLKIVKSSLRRT